MSDILPDTPRLGRSVCPGCVSDYDPASTEIVDVVYCGDHLPSRQGLDDAKATGGILSGGAEADGHDCREMQKLIR